MNAKKVTASTPAPLAHRVPAEVSALIQTYSAWIEEQTGQKVDPMSVYLGSQLRGLFQKSDGNQARLAEAAKARAAKASQPASAAKTALKAKAQPKKVTRRRPAKGSTVATKAGVVIAEQRHIDATTTPTTTGAKAGA
ncbi:hypothetical protein [Microbacterium terrisoli]|uniref:hypothetical protein n=1 Tax=Microbacterium terrisoli TaxID=3242192 RepID=UPI002804E734|nr:hypothetical protein [Microbacterium protaetiae]